MGQLDAQQRVAVEASCSARQIVLAPPGSGKTEVVVRLAERLIDSEGLSPFDDLLIVSFSRAAIGALRRRGASSAAPALMASRTVDALAAALLADGPMDGWEAADFDRRVDLALQQIRTDGLPPELRDVQHVIVDEVQDLVGRRAGLILEILRSLSAGAGFSLLGDPNQAVYDFQLRDEQYGMASRDFLEEVRNLGNVREIRLSGQYRASTQDTRRAALAGTSGAPAARIKELRSFLASVPSAGDVSALARPAARWAGSTAFLCRTNGEALVVASRLHSAGLSVGLRAAAEELPLVPWIAEVLGPIEAPVIQRTDVIDRLESVPCGPDLAWRLLKSVERDYRTPDRLDAHRLSQRLAAGLAPVELRQGLDGAVVSTIHRAKGLEFDNVVLVNASELLPGDAGDEERAVAYVGASRARARLVTAKCERPPFLRRDSATGRWMIGGPQSWQTSAFEVRGIDMNPTSAGDAGQVSLGASVSAVVNRSRSDFDRPIYDLVAGQRVLGRTDVRFGELLARRCRGPRRSGRPWPDLSGLFVESVQTIASPSAVAGQRLRVGARVAGLGRLDWEGTARD